MLYLYTDITPNVGDNLHYNISSIEEYQSRFENNLFSTIEETNYTFNGGTLQVKLAPEDVQRVTYIIHRVGAYYMCYHVARVFYQSSMAIFTISVDLWASYIARCVFSSTEITRTNADVEGIFDNIAVTEGRTASELEITEYNMDTTPLCLAVHIVYVTSEGAVLNNNASSNTKLFLFELKAMPEGSQTIQQLIDAVGGIYGAKASITIGGTETPFSTTVDAYVTQAWVIPSTFVPAYSDADVNVFKFNAVNVEGDSLIPSYQITEGIKTINLPSIEVDPNYEYYVGVPTNGLKCARNRTINAQIIIESTRTELKITAIQGDRAHDITNAFAVPLATNDGNLTSLQQLQQAVKLSGQVMGGMTEFAEGDYASAIYRSMGALVGAFGNSTNARYIAGGNGVGLYQGQVGSWIISARSPFSVVKHKSIFDEQKRAIEYGFQTSQFCESPLEYLTKARIYDAPELFVKALTRVTGVNVDAVNFITNEFARGIKLV